MDFKVFVFVLTGLALIGANLLDLQADGSCVFEYSVNNKMRNEIRAEIDAIAGRAMMDAILGGGGELPSFDDSI